MSKHKFTSNPSVSFAMEVAGTYNRVGVARSAAALSYFLILTLFPMLLCLNYFIGSFHLDLERLLMTLDQFLPDVALSVIRDYLSYAASSQSPGMLWAGLITIVISASAGLRTLFRTMDDLYEVHTRSGMGQFLTSVILSFLLMPTIYLSLVVIFTGHWFFGLLEDHLPQVIRAQLPLAVLSDLWLWLRYLLLFCFVLLLVLLVYRIGTPRAAVRGRSVILPAFLTALAMVACSVLFSWFIGMSTRYTLVYGSLASLIILLVWLYFCGNILLIGAVVGRCRYRRLDARDRA